VDARAGGRDLVDEVDPLDYFLGGLAVAFGKLDRRPLVVAPVQFFKMGDDLVGEHPAAGTGNDGKVCRV